MKAEDLINLIRQRYPVDRPDGRQSHVVLEQVPDGTGMHQRRWIDAVVFSLWESRGLFRLAFEVKVSRSDFIQELQNPLKHKWVLECFHEFWFVAPQDVIQMDELPPSTGWMCPRGSKLIIKKHAVQNPHPKLDDILLAAFMRAASKEINRVSSLTAKDILESSEEHRITKIYQDAVTTFLNQMGIRKYADPSTQEELLEWLNEATMDHQLKQDKEQLLDIASRFQREIICLLNLFLIIANKSLPARDELGKYVVSAYGGEDKENVKTLKKYAKDKAFDTQKRYAQLVEIVLNWDKEFQ